MKSLINREFPLSLWLMPWQSESIHVNPDISVVLFLYIVMFVLLYLKNGRMLYTKK